MKKPVFKDLLVITKRSVIPGILCSLIFTACQNTTEEQDKAAYAQSSVREPLAQNEPPASSEPEIQPENTEEVTTTVNHPVISKITTKTNDDHLVKTTLTVREQFIDSLNKIVPVFDNTKYNHVSVSYFTSLASNLGGKAFFAESSNDLSKEIMEILTSRLDDGTDIVFLIDKTGSMDDDIANVKNSMDLIMKYLSNFHNVKLGIASYGDKNYHYGLWYNKIDLGATTSELKSFMDSYTTIGNPDVAESVNDAIVKTVREMSWTDGNKRLLVVIGDAPSQKPPLSDYTDNQVIAVCDSMHVMFNLYPIIIAATADGQKDTPFKTDFVKTYPNPVNQTLKADFDTEGQFFYELNDMSGRAILKSQTNSQNATIDMSAVANGTYLLQMYNAEGDKYYSKPLIVQH